MPVDYSKFSTHFGKIYYDGNEASQYRLKQYKKFQKGSTGRITTIPKQYGKYFNSNTQFTTRQGHLKPWAKALTLKGGPNPNYNWSRVNYRDFNGKIGRVASNQSWGAKLNKGGSGILFGSKEWLRHIQIVLHALYISAENFRIVIAQRALKVFQDSFRYQQFYSNRSHRWAALSPATLKKRARRGTGSKILTEYGDLVRSIKIKEHEGAISSLVYTDIVPANPAHHKKHSICYAGYHNEGKGTYGAAWNGHKPKGYIKRQFMGHSSHLDPYSNKFIQKMIKLYLFDNVFLIRKT